MKKNFKSKGIAILIMLVMLPQWLNFLIRTYSWMALLEDTGIINSLLGSIGIDPVHMINPSGAVILGMVYNYIPYMILPLYSVLTKINGSVIEAAQDLGANNVKVFMKVIIPMSMPGIISGITMVFVPAVSTFIISNKKPPRIIGILIKKLYSEDFDSELPINIKAEIVLPDLEIPGRTAKP